MSKKYDDLSLIPDDELEAAEAESADFINKVDEQVMELKEQMRAEAQAINDVRRELERRKRGRADRDPRTQGIGG